jgi:hypothetical protein
MGAADTQPTGNVSHAVTTFGNLLDGFKLEFFCERGLLLMNTSKIAVSLPLCGVYETGGDSQYPDKSPCIRHV